ncbi:MAG TPA: HEAT repeat domain-containing protein, partial [Gemmatimonadales bacterium]
MSTRLFLFLLSLGCLTLEPSMAWGQEEAIVEQLAPVLAAEDARHWQADLFQRALVAPDSVVRRVAALAAGRIGDLRATPLLLRLLEQSDTTVSVAAAFALGLLRDSAAVQPLIQRLTGLPPLDTATADEAVTALAKIGGRQSAEFFAGVLQGTIALSQADPSTATSQMLLESWRLGREARVDALVPFADDTLQSIRWRTIFSLGRLRSPLAAKQLIAALRAPDAATRSAAARALVREYTVAAKLAPATVAGLLVRAVDDEDPGVRINALRSVASYRDPALSVTVGPRVDDP